jgi:hypothetical protein
MSSLLEAQADHAKRVLKITPEFAHPNTVAFRREE